MRDLLVHNKMFRVLLGYQFFSGIGGAMFSMFMLLSVHLIYENPIYTGIAGFLMAAPFIFSFAVGPIVDRRNKVAIMRFTTFWEFLVLALLAFSPLQETFGVLFMFAVIFTYNIAALFEAPAGTAFLPQIVDEDKILQANSIINTVAMVGGLIIGVVLFTTLGNDLDLRLIYGISAALLGFALLASMFLRNVAATEAETPNYLEDLKQGARFIRSNILLYTITAGVAMSFVAEVAHVNRPMFVEYHVGAQGYIVFVVVGLVGGIAASTLAGALGNKFKVGQLIFALLACACVVRISFALVLPRSYVGGLVTMVLYVAIGTAVAIVLHTLIQKIPSKDMVGRVTTISTTCSAIFVTIGALLGGFLGSAVTDVAHVFIYQGISLAVIGLFVILVPSVRKLPKLDQIGKDDEAEVQA